MPQQGLAASGAAPWSGARVRRVQRCGSTNDLALEALRAGERDLWIVADEQTGGRGRLGRAWTPRPGNLYASLALVDPAAPAQAPQIGFVAALAAHDAAAAITGASARFGLKWPNDLLFDRRKVAGVLIEGTTLPGGALAVAVGVGVNVVDHPADTRIPAAALAEARAGVDAAATFAALAAAMATRLAQWRDEGFSAIRREWLARALGLDERITVARGADTLEGVFVGLDGEGRLRLQGDDGLSVVDAGDVFLTSAF